MSTAIGFGTEIRDVAEFNRRAVIALKSVVLNGGRQWGKGFVQSVIERIEGGQALTGPQQQALYNTVHGYRRDITDKLLTDYASTRAKGY